MAALSLDTVPLHRAEKETLHEKTMPYKKDGVETRPYYKART